MGLDSHGSLGSATQILASDEMMIRVRREAVEQRAARFPEYRTAVKALATATDETHYTVPGPEYLALVRKYVSPKQASAPRRKMFALGDAVETVLTSVGITKELVQRVTRTKDCGCKARQKWLNQWGYKQQERIEKAVNTAAKWYGIT